jgi:uncharacterized protein (TIGR03000 family)
MGGSWGGSGGSWGGSGGSWGGSGGYYGVPTVAQAAPVVTDSLLAYLDVRVPADAIVYLQDQRMTMSGPRRRFVTPAIVDGKPHLYTIKVEAQHEGRSVTKTTQVEVRAGQEVQVVVAFDAKTPDNHVASITPPPSH